MGRGARRRPERLWLKLKEVRAGLGLSQGGMAKLLIETNHVFDEYITRERISEFEQQEGREPDLLTIKAYADIAGISIDVLIDDKVDLPEKLPTAKLKRWPRGRPQKRAAKATVNAITVTLWLDIESESHVARDEHRARKGIEKSHLRQYRMKKLSDRDYELTLSYEDDKDLDERIYALLGEIMREARRRKCNIKVNVREKGAERYW
jgi:transcriptional regulator with XRE-family HTH domain